MLLALLSAAGLGSSFTKIEGFISRVVFYSCMHALNDTGWRGGEQSSIAFYSVSVTIRLSVAVKPIMLTATTSERLRLVLVTLDSLPP